MSRLIDKKNFAVIFIPAACAIAITLLIWFLFKKNDPFIPCQDSVSQTFVLEEQCIKGRMEFRVNKPLNEKITVQYCIPWHKKNLSRTTEIIFYAPYNGDAPRIQKGLPSWLTPLWHKYKFPVFSMTIITDKKSAHSSSYYIYPSSGWFEIVLKIEKYIRDTFSLGDGQLLILGESSGGSMAQQMSCAFPQYIKRAAWHGGSRYIIPPILNSTEVLAINSWGDYSAEPTQNFVEANIQQGNKTLYLEVPPLLSNGYVKDPHAATQLSYDLMITFITDDVNAFRTNLKRVPALNFEKQDYFELPNDMPYHRDMIILWDAPSWSKQFELLLKNSAWEFSNNGFHVSVKRSEAMSTEELVFFIEQWLREKALSDNITIISTRKEISEYLPDILHKSRLLIVENENEIVQILQTGI